MISYTFRKKTNLVYPAYSRVDRGDLGTLHLHWHFLFPLSDDCLRRTLLHALPCPQSKMKILNISFPWVRSKTKTIELQSMLHNGLKLNSICVKFQMISIQTHCALNKSCISLSLCLKQPRLHIACRTSGSIASAEGSTLVCTTSIIGNSCSSSPLPPAVTQGWRVISAN